jgi:Asp-tRNA(Asn)/Glu-tRNA(Gln) amidotransferase A subunit family amidase
LDDPQFEPFLKTFVDLDFDWNLTKKNAGAIIQFHGDDDPYVPLAHAKDLAEKLDSELIVIKDGGHLSEESNYTKFPELLDKIKEIISPAAPTKAPKSLPKLKIGLVKEFIGDGVDADVRQRTLDFADKLRAAGHMVEEVDLPMAKYALPIYYIVVPAEVSSNLARYDGVRYGVRFAAAKTLNELYGQSRDAGFMPENKRRVMIGSYVLSSGYFDAYYLQAQKARTLLINEFNKLFASYDFLIGPTAPTPAFRLGENTADPIKMYLSDIMTVPASLAGLPAISLPNGTDKNGLPIGVQIIVAMRSDARLLRFAREVEE